MKLVVLQYFFPLLPPYITSLLLQWKEESSAAKDMNRGFIADDDIDNDMMEEEEEGFSEDLADDEKKKRVGGGRRGGASSPPSCQVERCGADLTDAKRYHRRHKVCETHAKAPVVAVAGLRQRFCQQCSRFHELSEFDEVKRSCRRRLAGHNERRRKTAAESSAEGTSRRGMANSQMKDGQCRQGDDRSRLSMPIPGNPAFKRSQYR